MSNLVGIGNSQVPTNAMLGGLAYQDSVGEINFDKIKARTSDTAVDVFVYDTRKDSDGGAWRHRTQNTSWYNEGESERRGARKEFPAVAVIVASSSGLIIYDADDPNCPMWMEFVNNNANWLKHTASGPNSVVALNGNLVSCGGGNPGRLSVVNFVSDNGYVTEPGYTYRHSWIATRNSTGVGGANGNDTVNPRHIVNITCNGVAITVLPNALIDIDTGLPIPTIAVATDGGVSVIKDDGTVIDLKRTSDDDVHHVAFDDDRVLMFMELGAIYVATIPDADQSGNPNGAWSVYGTYSANSSGTNYPKIIGTGAGVGLVSMKDNIFATAGYNSTLDKYKGLSILAQNVSSSGNGMVAWIKKDFNTGWMHGDCVGAWLADTTVESLTANTNLASNCTDGGTSRLTSETYTSGATSWQMVDNTGNNNGYVVVEFKGLTVGQTYFISMTWDNNAALDSGYQHRVVHKNGLAGENSTNFMHWNKTNGSAETLKGIFTAQTTDTDDLVMYANAITLNVSAFNIRQIDDEDRSISNNGLAVYGTVTKTAVATGAELVSYGGFSATNFLEQPYNSDLNWQNSNFSVYGWFKLATNNSQQTLMMLMQPDGEVDYLLIEQQSDGDMRFQVDSQNGASVAYATTLPTGVWHHYCGVNIDNDKTYLYINGEPTGLHNGTLHGTSDFDNTSAKLTIGRKSKASYNNASSTPFGGQMALWRISNTTPSAEQIKKMYDDEKHFFQENAKCTLYGSSNEVTAVAYDDSNDILHAGTSAGRSEFNGLARINNTTTAVTTAISASNGLVAEQ